MSMWHYTNRTHEDNKGGGVKTATISYVNDTKEEVKAETPKKKVSVKKK